MRTPFALLVLLALALNTLCITQTYAQKCPSQLVESYKTAGASFESIDLFEQLPQSRTPSRLTAELQSDYTLLQLNAQTLNELRSTKATTLQLQLPQAGRSTLQLELVKVDLFANGPYIRLASTNQLTRVNPGLHYRGTVKGDPNSLVAISVLDDEVMGLISTTATGNLVLGRLQHDGQEGEHILYPDMEVFENEQFVCATPDDPHTYTRAELEHSTGQRNTDKCVGVYFEIDYDIFQSKGGTNSAVNYITGLFNEVATLYANDNITVNISELMVWDTPSPYAGSSSSVLLNQFQNYRTSFNGDVAQLLSYKASGGVAVLSGLCHPITAARMSFSSISSSYNTVPTYSFTVMVVAHELGHLLGSQHTHACAWNGNGTAIDGCAGFTEGSCGNPGIPSNGGTIMSYCHITSTGINFGKGFGDQPAAVIRNFINNASCVGTCTTSGGNNGDDDPPVTATCTENTVYLTIALDAYAKETSWQLLDDEGEVIEEFGPYAKNKLNSTVRDTFCLPDGDYEFVMLDEEGDGICCTYGDGSYLLEDEEGNELAAGGEFDEEESTDFTLPYEPNNGDPNCLVINFNDYDIIPFGGSQDAGQYEIQSNGDVLKIENNAWKAIDLPYVVTPQTVIEFDFGSTLQGEIHGIGFDDNNSISSSKTFKVHGTQSWGIRVFDNYSNSGTWRRYTIPVGQYYQGDFIKLFFVADHDGSPRNGNSFFRNLVIYEGTGCQSNLEADMELSDLSTTTIPDLQLSPNPAQQYVNLNVNGFPMEGATVQLFDLTGAKIADLQWTGSANPHQLPVDISTLAPGSYIVRLQKDEHHLSGKFIVTR
ncbi:MAG: zinc-dependent metalloprotease [Bacteroidota bacterium]